MHIVSDPQAGSLEERFARLQDTVIPAYEAEKARWAELPDWRRIQMNDWRLQIDTLEAILCHDLAAQAHRAGDVMAATRFLAMAMACSTRVRLHRRMASRCRVEGPGTGPPIIGGAAQSPHEGPSPLKETR